MSLQTIKTAYGNINGCEVGDMMVLGRVANEVDKEFHPEEYESPENSHEAASTPRIIARTALRTEVSLSL